MARVLAQAFCNEMGVKSVVFESAGSNVEATLRSYEEVVEFMQSRYFNIKKHLSQPINFQMVRRADMIMCMTHDIAKQVKATIGEPHDQKVVVLNKAVGFGSTRSKQDITAILKLDEQTLMSVFSQLKAAVGRLVRYIGDGDEVEDFGAKKVADTSKGPLDSPQVRQFISHYIIEFISRAYESPDAEMIADHLQMVGQHISAMEVEELCTTDLRARLNRTIEGRFELDAQFEEEEKQRSSRSSRTSSDSNGANFTFKEEKGTLTEDEAYEVLAITSSTSKSDARKSLKKLLTRYHPDKFHDDPEFRTMAEQKAKQINLAWETIEDKLKE